MNFFERSLAGRKIHSVHVDSEITCIMLSDGTQVTIRGVVIVEPGSACQVSTWFQPESDTSGQQARANSAIE